MSITPDRIVIATQDDPKEAVEAELAKDVWDVRVFGTPYHAHRGEHTLNFTVVTPVFRPLVKRFMQYRVAQFTHSDCRFRLRHIADFTNYYAKRCPAATGFAGLSRSDIEAYLLHMKKTPMKGGKPCSQNHISRTMNALKVFFEYLQRVDSPDAPKTAIPKLLWPDELKQPKTANMEPKFIPQSVLEQLDEHLHLLSPATRPVVIVLRASGFRIADVLNLRYHNCLEKTKSGWWLVGDIQKTRIQKHKMPITEPIAQVVAEQCVYAENRHLTACNPERYLFPSPYRTCIGKPLSSLRVTRALNDLANRCNITDDTGKIYHFAVHGFRHTKGVELINNGMNILHVQKLLGHLSPEMTLRYAKILDSTMREEWEKAVANGALRISVDGTPRAYSAEELENEDQVEWDYIRENLDAVRLPYGYCLKPKKAECSHQDIPCYTCRHLCITAEFLPQFRTLREDTLRLIEQGEQQGRLQWVERNQRTLGRIDPIIQALEQKKIHHPAGKQMREYTPAERKKRTDNGQQALSL